MAKRTRKSLVCTLGLALLALPAAADHHEGAAEHAQHGGEQMSPEMQAEMEAWMAAGKPGAEHASLAESAGSYDCTVKMWMGPGEPSVSQATSKREMILDGRVLAEHFEGDMMGMPFVGHGMTGYDNTRKMYWSTWNDSMTTGIMVAWGKWDEAKQGIVFEGEMTNPMTGQPTKVQMVARRTEPGTEVFEMWEPRGEGGAMVKTMEIQSVKQ